MAISQRDENRLKEIVKELERLHDKIKPAQLYNTEEKKVFLNREEATEFVALFDRKKELLDEIHSIVLGKPDEVETDKA